MSNTTTKRRDAKPAARDWHPEDIKAEVRKRGSSLAELSRENGYAESAGSMVLRQAWPRLEAIIAKFLGVRAWEIWPSRYEAKKPKSRAWTRSERAA